MTRHSVRRLPIRLQQAVDELNLDQQEACRKLVRLSDESQMLNREMLNLRTLTISKHLAMTKKLAADQ
jgi:hypothetical protein